MDFHAQTNKYSYTSRRAEPAWVNLVKDILESRHVNHALDIGCGGGIYTKALNEIGLPLVTGVDSSEIMLRQRLRIARRDQEYSSTKEKHRKPVWNKRAATLFWNVL